MKKHLTAAALLLVALQVSFAETSYGLREIVEIALRENATVKRSGIELNALRRKYDKRWAAVVPSPSAGIGATRADESADYAVAASASASLALSAASFADIGQARLNYEAASITGAATAREVELSVRKAFFQILYDQEYLDYLRQTVDTAMRQYELTVKNQRAGLVPILDELTARVNYQNAALVLASAESSFRNDLSSLRQAAGIPQGEGLRVSGSLESSLPKGGIKTDGIEPTSPEYALLGKRLEAAQFARKMSSLGVWSPTLTCSVGARKTLLATQANGSTFAPSVTVSLSFPVGDLLPWSAAKESVLAADDSIRDIAIQLNAAKTADVAKFESLIRDIRDAETTIETRRLTVSLAEESYRLTEEAFKAGSKDFIALKGAADALQEAKTGLMKERYGLISSVMDLENLCGMPFGSLLEEK